MKKTLVALVAGALLAGSPQRSVAQTATFDVPAECGDELAFESELTRLAGADAARARPASLRIARESEGGAYRLTLVLGGQTRVLEHADCRVLLRSAAVIAAAATKAQAEAPATAAAPPPTASPPVVPAPAPEPSAPEPSAPESHAARGGRLDGSVAVGVGAAAGVVPKPTGAFELRGGVLAGLFGASLGVRYFPPRLVKVEGRGVDVWGLGFRAAAVLAPSPAFDISLGLDADRLSGQGSGVSKPERDSAWTLAPSAELAVIPYKNRHLALELAAEARYALVRPVFVVTGFQELYRVPNWGMVLVLRGAWRFP